MTSKRLFAVTSIALLCCFAIGCSSNSNSSSKQTQTGVQIISPQTSPTIELASTPQTVTLTANQPVNWSLQAGGVNCLKPQGTFSSTSGTTTTYTAPATNNSNCPSSSPLLITVLANSISDPTQEAAIQITIVQTSPTIQTSASSATLFPSPCPAPGTVMDTTTIGTLHNAVAQVGVPYLVPIFDIGYSNGSNGVPSAPQGVPPYKWTMTGSLPAGLSMYAGTDTSNIVIQGTPVTAGCNSSNTFTLQLTDATGVTSPPVTYTIAVIPPALKVQGPALSSVYSITSDPNDPGVPFTPATYLASNGLAPYTWTALPSNNTPPPGLSLAQISAGSNAAIVSGTSGPGSSGPLGSVYTNQFQVTDNQSPYPASAITSQINFSAKVLPQFCTDQLDEGGVTTSAATIQPSAANGGTIGGNVVSTDSYLKGPFAFSLRGLDANRGPMAIAGSATFDGAGNVTAGEVDATSRTGHQLLTIQSGSSYVVGVATFGVGSPSIFYNRGCMSLNLKDSQGHLSTTNFAMALGGCSNQYTEQTIVKTTDNACGMTQSGGQNVAAGYFTRGRITEYDCDPGTTCSAPSGVRASGIIRLQDPTSFSAGVSGPYAFGLSGRDASSGRYAMAGSFQASSGTLSAVAADIDDAGTVSGALTGGSGSLSSADANGRVSGSLTVGQASIDFAGYVVNGGEVMLATTDTLGAGHPVLGGEAVSSGTSFTNASLQNAHIYHLAGVTNNSPDVSIGVLSFDGISSFTGTQYEDQAGTLGTVSLSGAYSIDGSTGRVLLFAPVQGQNIGPHPFVGYVIPLPASLNRTNCSANEASCISGFLVGTDATAQDGVLEYQTSLNGPPPPFSNQFILGDYTFGTDQAVTSKTPVVAGTAIAAISANSSSSGSLQTIIQDTFFGDPNYCLQAGCYLFIPSQTLSGSYSVTSNGTGSFGSGKWSVTNGPVVFYIDQSTATSNGGSVQLDPQPSIVVAEQ